MKNKHITQVTDYVFAHFRGIVDAMSHEGEHFQGNETELPSPESFPVSHDIESVSNQEREPVEDHYLLLADIHNDLVSAKASLEERGIVDHQGDWCESAHNEHIVVLGDSVNKEDPDSHVLKWLKHLQKETTNANKVTVLLGNHEFDLLDAVATTGNYHNPLKEKHIAYLANCPIVYKKGPVLFLHGFPTRELVEELAEQYEECGGDVPNENWYVNERFSADMKKWLNVPRQDVVALPVCNYARARVANQSISEETYYTREGAHMSALLKRMGVNTVVHGHRKQRTGGQVIEKYLPGICMINDDAAISQNKNEDGVHRVASVDIRTHNNEVKALCVYKKDTRKTHIPVETKRVTIH